MQSKGEGREGQGRRKREREQDEMNEMRKGAVNVNR